MIVSFAAAATTTNIILGSICQYGKLFIDFIEVYTHQTKILNYLALSCEIYFRFYKMNKLVAYQLITKILKISVGGYFAVCES